MHHESEQLLTRRDALTPRINASDVRANVNIANDRASPSPARESKGDDVGRSAMTEVFLVYSRNGCPTNERDRDHRVFRSLRSKRGDYGRFDARLGYAEPMDARRNRH